MYILNAGDFGGACPKGKELQVNVLIVLFYFSPVKKNIVAIR